MRHTLAVAAIVAALLFPAYAQFGSAIPAGTRISIRTNETISAGADDVGREYSAEIASDVLGQGGAVLVPKGSPAELTISDANSGTMGVGSNEVSLALRSIRVDGRTYMVDSNLVQQQGKRGIGANRRTAEMTGGGALLGTLIGAIAGGGKGAAIGAAVGAAGGATTQVLTRGHDVKVPAESVLTFRLDEPVRLH
jgi:hypothetical protein